MSYSQEFLLHAAKAHINFARKNPRFFPLGTEMYGYILLLTPVKYLNDTANVHLLFGYSPELIMKLPEQKGMSLSASEYPLSMTFTKKQNCEIDTMIIKKFFKQNGCVKPYVKALWAQTSKTNTMCIEEKAFKHAFCENCKYATKENFYRVECSRSLREKYMASASEEKELQFEVRLVSPATAYDFMCMLKKAYPDAFIIDPTDESFLSVISRCEEEYLTKSAKFYLQINFAERLSKLPKADGVDVFATVGYTYLLQDLIKIQPSGLFKKIVDNMTED